MDIPTFLRKKSCSNPPLATHETYQARAALRVLRLIVNGKGFRSFIGKEGFKDDDIPRLIGLESHSDVEVSMKEGQQLLKARLSELEGKSHKPDLLDPFCHGAAHVDRTECTRGMDAHVIQEAGTAASPPHPCR